MKAFASAKDHKNDFYNRLQIRLINPSEQNFGNGSKHILAKVVMEVKDKIKLLLLKSTDDVLSWFRKITHKVDKSFMQMDVCSMYPSITETLLKASLR